MPSPFDQFQFICRWYSHTQKWPDVLHHESLNYPTLALETMLMLIYLNTDCSWTQTPEHQLLPFSTPLSFSWSTQWFSGLSLYSMFLKLLSTTTLSGGRLMMMSAVLASLSNCAFPLTLAWPGRYIHTSLCSWRLCMAALQSGSHPRLCCWHHIHWAWIMAWVRSVSLIGYVLYYMCDCPCHPGTIVIVLHVWLPLPPWDNSHCITCVTAPATLGL